MVSTVVQYLLPPLTRRTSALKLALDELLPFPHARLEVLKLRLKLALRLGLLGLPVEALRVGDKLPERLLALPKLLLAALGLLRGPLRKATGHIERDRTILWGERGPDRTEKTGQGLPVAGALVALRPPTGKVLLGVDARQVGALRWVRSLWDLKGLPSCLV
jgi:hypothetical protein